jgi:hypothetical protein
VLRPAPARPLARTWVAMRPKFGNARDLFWPGRPLSNSERACDLIGPLGLSDSASRGALFRTLQSCDNARGNVATLEWDVRASATDSRQLRSFFEAKYPNRTFSEASQFDFRDRRHSGRGLRPDHALAAACAWARCVVLLFKTNAPPRLHVAADPRAKDPASGGFPWLRTPVSRRQTVHAFLLA